MTKIVTLGGGSGQYDLLSGLKLYSSQHPRKLSQNNISVVVSTMDNGGHTGALLEARIPKDIKGNYLPPGDIRHCLSALANNEKKVIEFEQRIKEGSNAGSVVGNIRIDAAYERHGNNFEKAIEEFRGKDELDVRAKIYPCTLKRAKFLGTLRNGYRIEGEEELVEKSISYNSPIKTVFLKPRNIEGNAHAVKAIRHADKVVLSQGSLYTSLIPNLLVRDIADAIRKTKGKVIYIMNLVTQRGETDGYSAHKHLETLESYLGENVIDRIILHQGFVPSHLQEKYNREGQKTVSDDLPAEKYIIRTNLLADDAKSMTVLRHDPLKLAEVIMKI